MGVRGRRGVRVMGEQRKEEEGWRERGSWGKCGERERYWSDLGVKELICKS